MSADVISMKSRGIEPWLRSPLCMIAHPPQGTFAMLLRILLVTISLLSGGTAIGQAADPPVSLELVTERGFAIDGVQRWMKFLRDFGFSSLRVRAAQPADEPVIDRRGSEDAPRYAVTGVLTAGNRLVLPGLELRYGQRKELTSWLQKLRSGGLEAIASPVGEFGLRDKQLVTLRTALKKPVSFPTKGKPIRDLIEQLQRTLEVAVEVDASARQLLSSQNTVLDELEGLSCGTALAAAVRPYGLIVTPTGQGTRTVGVRVARSGKPEDAWPIGTRPEKSPANLAPDLFKFINVEINDRPLSEALDAIQQRVELPFLFDHNALALYEVDLETHVDLPAKKTFYQDILKKLLFQAMLKCDLRADDSGAPFLWITSTRQQPGT